MFGHNTPKDHFLRLYPLQMINIFNECGIVLYLPLAYYYAAQLSLEDIMFGVERPDGSREMLSDADKYLILNGKEELQLLRRNVTFEWLMMHTRTGPVEQHDLGCNGGLRKHGTTCYEFIQDMYEAFNGPWSDFLSTRYDALNTLAPELLDIIDENLCHACSNLFMPRVSEGLLQSLDQLPLMFCEKTWDELAQRQKELAAEWYDPSIEEEDDVE